MELSQPCLSEMPVNGIYRGLLRHRRFTPVDHTFRYSITMVFFDLATVATQFKSQPLVSCQFPAPGWFRRKDYHGDPERSLDVHIREVVHQQLGFVPRGRIFLLTQLRYWGFLMNPIAVFYCYNTAGTLEAVVLQVTNTPWREKILYPLKASPGKPHQAFSFKKEMHVSPFNPMEMQYSCRLSEPGQKLFMHIENSRDGEVHTDATLSLSASPMTASALGGQVLRFPPETLKVLYGIYGNAFKLWLKRSPLYAHPSTRKESHKSAEVQL